eukprot:g5173.t1
MSVQRKERETESASARARARKGSIGTSTPIKGFAFSCFASCLAEAVTCPIDVTKVRLQLAGELGSKNPYQNGALRAAVSIAREEGARALWKGLPPALLRQASYGTIRYGAYEPIKQMLNRDTVEGGASAARPFPLWKKVLAGCICGSVGSFAATPCDLVKIRLQADDKAGPGQQKRYNGTLSAFREIAKTEGFFGLWRGAGPTVTRAAVGAMTELPMYDEVKQALLRSGMDEGIGLHLTAALAAGLFSTFCMNPFDVAKSRVMNQKVSPGGELRYSGMLDCFVQTVRSEGVKSLWKGFGPSYARIGPRVVIIFLTIEKLRELFD